MDAEGGQVGDLDQSTFEFDVAASGDHESSGLTVEPPRFSWVERVLEHAESVFCQMRYGIIEVHVSLKAPSIRTRSKI